MPDFPDFTSDEILESYRIGNEGYWGQIMEEQERKNNYDDEGEDLDDIELEEDIWDEK